MGFSACIYCYTQACALTARFHPYLQPAEARSDGGIFSVALSVDLHPPHLNAHAPYEASILLGVQTFLSLSAHGERKSDCPTYLKRPNILLPM